MPGGDNQSEAVTVVVADDHQAVRDAVRGLLGGAEGFRLVGAARDGEEACALAYRLRPHVVLMDLRMPGLDGVEATRRIRTACPETRVVVMTALGDRRELRRAREAGAVACLLKDAEPAKLLAALRAAGECPAS